MAVRELLLAADAYHGPRREICMREAHLMCDNTFVLIRILVVSE